MGPVQIVALLSLSVLAVGLFPTLLHLHKRRVKPNLKLVGAFGHVEALLSPTGTVIVDGELWPARSTDGSSLAQQRKIQITGTDGLSLLVKACD